jgi:sulfoxide reductase heme-binding subunit YedZ
MFEFSYLDISGAMGLCATGALTLNMLMGMLLSTAYKRSPLWKKMPTYIQKLSMDDLHNWTAYIALLFVLLHPFFLLLDTTQTFTISDVLWPVNAPKQPWVVLLGTISLYALLLVIITTQKVIKRKMSFRFWKNLHLISYASCWLFLVHGVLMDPLLKDRPVDWLDAEKFFSEGCLLLVIVAVILRFRYHLQKNKS